MNLTLFKDGIKIDSKGRINLSEEQWAAFCEHLHCVGYGTKYQRQMIKACINGAIDLGLKDLKKKNKKS